MAAIEGEVLHISPFYSMCCRLEKKHLDDTQRAKCSKASEVAGGLPRCSTCYSKVLKNWIFFPSYFLSASHLSARLQSHVEGEKQIKQYIKSSVVHISCVGLLPQICQCSPGNWRSSCWEVKRSRHPNMLSSKTRSPSPTPHLYLMQDVSCTGWCFVTPQSIKPWLPVASYSVTF